MTRKHYIRLARIIKDNSVSDELEGKLIKYIAKDSLILDMCDMLKQDNSLFDKDRFINACND